MQNAEESVVSQVPYPKDATHFAIQKVVAVEGGGATWKTQTFEDPSAPGTRLQYLTIEPGVFADPRKLKADIRRNWDVGTYRFRWVRAEDGKMKAKGVSIQFELTDPRTEGAAPAPGRSDPQMPGGRVAVDGVEHPASLVAVLSPEMQQFFAMQSMMSTIGRAERERDAEANRQQFQLQMQMMQGQMQMFGQVLANAMGGAKQGGGGVDARDIEIMMLRQEARFRQMLEGASAGGDDPDDRDWTKPIGELIGAEVKRAIVEIAEEVVDPEELVPIVKAVVPALFMNIKAAIDEGKQKAQARSAKAKAAATANGAPAEGVTQ